MPYIYVEELDEGMEEADVRSVSDYHALELERDTLVGERDALQAEYDALTGERDNLAAELDNAKVKFADAFLSTPQKAKEKQAEEMKEEERPMTFEALFEERNDSNGN